jgi:hypothetical protein
MMPVQAAGQQRTVLPPYSRLIAARRSLSRKWIPYGMRSGSRAYCETDAPLRDERAHDGNLDDSSSAYGVPLTCARRSCDDHGVPVDQHLVKAAVDQADRRWPDRDAVAAAVRLEDGAVITGVSLSNFNSAMTCAPRQGPSAPPTRLAKRSLRLSV